MGGQAKSLYDLKNSLVDYARPDRFDLEITGIPTDLSREALDSAGSYAKTATIGSTTIGDIPIMRLGKRWQYPGDVAYGEFSIVFRIDIGFKIYKEVKAWQTSVVNPGNETVYNPINAKSGQIKIFQLSHTNNSDKVAEWTFKNVYPSAVSEISFDMENDTAIQEFTATFFYSYFDFKSNGYDPSSGNGLFAGANKVINFFRGIT